MQTKAIKGLTLYFDAEDQAAADLVDNACEHSAELIHTTWELATPADVRVYVMTSWLHFVFHSAPWTWRVLLAVTFPLWVWRVRRMWQIAGGWAQQYGRRRAIGIKPPRLLQAADLGVGKRIFVQDVDLDTKIQWNTCHELTHAFSTQLKLPVWLNEGLAMATVDKFAGKPTVQAASLNALAQATRKVNPRSYQGVRPTDPDALVYLFVRGYWITRYLEATQPGLLQDLLSQKMTHAALEDKVAAAYGTDRETFWRDIDEMIVEHFRPKTQTTTI